MRIAECRSCGRRSFEPRAICPECRGETFSEQQCDKIAEVVSTDIRVTPEGFQERYTLVLGRCDGTVVLFWKESSNA